MIIFSFEDDAYDQSINPGTLKKEIQIFLLLSLDHSR